MLLLNYSYKVEGAAIIKQPNVKKATKKKNGGKDVIEISYTVELTPEDADKRIIELQNAIVAEERTIDSANERIDKFKHEINELQNVK